MTPDLTEQNANILAETFEGDITLMHFYASWVKNGLNAKQAYKELHPEVTEGSAEVLATRLLVKVRKFNLSLVLQAFGLDYSNYFKQLKSGLEATKPDGRGNDVPDHRTRAYYHSKLGKLLGIETDEAMKGSNGEVPRPIPLLANLRDEE